MSVPMGATEVSYTIAIPENPEQGQPVDITIDFTVAVADRPGAGAQQHAAIEAGADTMVAYLRDQYPGLPVIATRRYTGFITGDTWPGV